MLTSRQIRAARGLLGWDATELAKRTDLSAKTITNIEEARTQAQAGSLERIAVVFIEQGVEFIPNQGVRLRPSGLEIFEGPERFDDFSDFTYEQIKTYGGDICLSVTDETLFAKYRKDTPAHYERMQKLYEEGRFTSFRILAHKSNFATKYTYNTYKWQRGTGLAPTAFYVFANCLALISFVHDTPPYVVVLQSTPLANAYRQAFDLAWHVAPNPPESAKKPKNE
jgi:transcriptional regulator with XRE-family HTH domain